MLQIHGKSDKLPAHESMSLEIASLIEDLQDRIRPLQGRLFPRQVLLELRDDGLQAQVLADGRPGNVRFDVPLPPLTCRHGIPLEREPIGDLIGDLMVRDNLMEAFVMAALPPAAAAWRVIEWPAGFAVPADPIQAVRSLDPASLRLPFPLSEAVIDIRPIAGSKALLAASSSEVVDAWIQVFNHAGARLERLAPAQSCEFLALRAHLEGVSSRDLVVLLTPGTSATRLLMVRDGTPCFDRAVAPEGPQLVEDVARSVAFYRRSDPEVRTVRLLLAASMPDADALAQRLGVQPEIIRSTPFDSLVIEGLAVAELES
jgi:Tfp pilus assembly PilM family ATPase